MKLTISNVVCVTLLCLASSLGTEGDMFSNRGERRLEIANKGTKAGYYACYYDGNLFLSDASYQLSQGTTDTNSIDYCKDSYAYAVSNFFETEVNYIVITLSGMSVADCTNNDIRLMDDRSNFWSYCNNGRPSTYTNNYQSRWVQIERRGAVSVTVGIRFTRTVVATNPPVNPPTNPPTNQPITVAPVTNQPLTGSCGKANGPNENGLKIVGGINATKNSWPWMAGLKQSNDFGGFSFFCGGALINNQWILTAAHCKPDDERTLVQAHLGDHNIQVDGSGEVRGKIIKWINNENYDANQIINDIALVKLDRPVTFSRNISPVCLPNGEKPVLEANGIVTGWGTMEASGNGNTISTFLKQVVIPIKDASKPNNHCYSEALPSTNICAGVKVGVEKDSCQGDSGGPFVMKDSSTNDYYIAGVVSWGIRCDGGGVYTNVQAFESWISTTIANN